MQLTVLRIASRLEIPRVTWYKVQTLCAVMKATLKFLQSVQLSGFTSNSQSDSSTTAHSDISSTPSAVSNSLTKQNDF